MFLRAHGATLWHYSGTCAMGQDPKMGAVVNHELQVHGISGLRVVDASVMPRVVGGNTNAPSIMIGEKAFDIINRSWSKNARPEAKKKTPESKQKNKQEL